MSAPVLVGARKPMSKALVTHPVYGSHRSGFSKNFEKANQNDT